MTWPPQNVPIYYADDHCCIIHGDCREILPQLDVQVDLVLTDPPYGINLNTDYTRFRDSKNGVRGRPDLRKKYARVIGDNIPFDPSFLLSYKNVILWGANYYTKHLPSYGSWFVWDKRAYNGHSLFSDAELAWCSSSMGVHIFSYCWHGFARQGERYEHYHPTQKPISLCIWCLNRFPKAQTILDPFIGSGSTIVAAKELGRKSIGIEIEERNCEIAVNRLRQEVMHFPYAQPSPHPALVQEALF